MKLVRRKQYMIGIVLILVVVIVLLKIFSMLCRTNKVEQYLGDTASSSYGWSYETLAGTKVTDVVPEFLDEYTMALPGEPAQAVKITRTFTETLPNASIGLYIYGAGVEVFVDERRIYSDFWGGERNEEGFLLLQKEDIEQIESDTGKSVCISLPEDYSGKELTVITYFAQGREGCAPVYPSLGNEETMYSSMVTEAVLPAVVLVLCAIFIVLTLLIFVLDIPNGKADFRLLLLSLFFLLMFLGEAYGSLPGTYSVLSEHMNLSFLGELYMAPLYLYLSFHLTKWRKYLISSAVVLWFLYEGMRMLLNEKEGLLMLTGRNGLGAFVLFAVVAGAFCAEYLCRRPKIKKDKMHYLYYGMLAVPVSILYILYGAQEWSGDVGMYLSQMLRSAVENHYYAIVHFLTDICGIMTIIIVLLEFIRRTIRARQMISVLEERSRLTLEGYNRMLKAEEATNSVRHEMRHHMIALMGILKEDGNKRACDYIAAVTEGLDALPAFRYSQNLLVNVIAGEYLDRAAAQGIEIEYSLSVPVDLEMADEDLSVFLTNMLENALEACEKMDGGQKRYIHVKMYVHNHFLFIGCINSSSFQSKEHDGSIKRKKDPRSHGYGMAAMSRIAEKYGSILKVEQSPLEFSVKTNLCLKMREI